MLWTNKFDQVLILQIEKRKLLQFGLGGPNYMIGLTTWIYIVYDPFPKDYLFMIFNLTIFVMLFLIYQHKTKDNRWSNQQKLNLNKKGWKIRNGKHVYNDEIKELQP